MILKQAATLSAFASVATAWLPEVNKQITSNNGTNLFTNSNGKIRGVNLGSQFIFEPWIAESVWKDMGCDGQKSEYDCVANIGQDAANSAFQKHWDTWITQDDIAEMQSYGLNTIRVPVGYWLKEDLVYSDSEYFPQGGFEYVERLCGWASDAGLYIIMDLHGAPGAQTAKNAFTGQYADSAGFFQDYQYERALKFLEWMTTNVHQNDAFRNVGMLEIVNEPLQDADQVSSMRTSYYPQAFDRIRAAEEQLNIDRNDYLHIQMMDEKWGSGDPNEALKDTYYTAYDDHRYLKWANVDVSQDSFISTSCSDELDSSTPTIVGEWSLSVPDDVENDSDWSTDSNQDFYKRWFAAQLTAYEKQQGWVFWTWKAQLGDYRWSYQDAVDAGVIPTDLNSVFHMGVCN
ncbi:Glycoside hydrolase family 5 [Aspergillus sclerotialis]|uniref:glucan endo-1,6-beta-glucosidase n=1 Tax=Aspergillus sclerotialis TaxID=2070753 RepID=A0A3A2Z7L0_9EURO|nr:Glycoside hydrolase family 5 [Aspergillus sclerotialis]